ncbi:MAG: class I adenylate-forming enzyme family protein [Hyphomicrobiaceae bacterium]
MFELLLEQAARQPDAPAVIDRGETISYGTLAGRAGRVAGALKADGVRRGEPLGLLAANSVEWLEVAYGVAALGAILVPFSTWSTADELAFLIADSGVRRMFAVARLGQQDFATPLLRARREGTLDKIVSLGADPIEGAVAFAAFASSSAVFAAAPGETVSAADTYVVLYTSGSSNRPKAVPLAHYATIENGFNIGERQGLGSNDRVLISIPLFWSYGAANALPAVLSHGAAMVLQNRFEPGEALDLIERHQCTALYTLPAMTNALLAHANFKPERTRSLRTGVTIGAPQDVVKAATELGAHSICNIYGSTESYGNCCVTPHDWPLERRASCQGPPLPGVSLRIRDADSGVLLPAGEIGQLEVTGYLTPGYRGNSAQHNKDVFTDDGWLRTGDLGALQADGSLRYAGRSSEMIKRAGINVSPAEVEEVLQQHPDVGLAGVTGAADARRDEIIVAFVVPRPGVNIDTGQLIAHCRAKLSGYKVPDKIHISTALPLTATGKLMRRELKSMAADDGSKS